MFRIWKKRNYFNKRPEGYVPVSVILDQSFNLRRCMYTLKGVLKCLYSLHTRGLIQQDLNINDIFVKDSFVSIMYFSSLAVNVKAIIYPLLFCLVCKGDIKISYCLLSFSANKFDCYQVLRARCNEKEMKPATTLNYKQYLFTKTNKTRFKTKECK